MKIELDYTVNCVPRYGWGKPAHRGLAELIALHRERYKSFLEQSLSLEEKFLEIPLFLDAHKNALAKFRTEILRIRDRSVEGALTSDDTQQAAIIREQLTTNIPATEPTWVNGFIPAFDSLVLYAMVSMFKPAQFVEVGSGFSTKFARRAINDNKLRTKITSIDPMPRTEIDEICDNVLRIPLEEADLRLFQTLVPNDIVFFDGSHRVLMNSDCAVMFLDIIPFLPRGVILQIHDIFLPDDYPLSLDSAYYSEQYLLAAMLLAGREHFEVLMPNHYVSRDAELSGILDPLWSHPYFEVAERHGSSFWLRII